MSITGREVDAIFSAPGQEGIRTGLGPLHALARRADLVAVALAAVSGEITTVKRAG